MFAERQKFLKGVPAKSCFGCALQCTCEGTNFCSIRAPHSTSLTRVNMNLRIVLILFQLFLNWTKTGLI